MVTAADVPVPLMIRFAVPVIPPPKVSRWVKVGASVRLLLSVMAPLKVLAALLVIFKVLPLLPEATVIGLANVPPPAFNVASTLPLVSPMVMTLEFAPKAFGLVSPETVPALMVKPPVKVFAPEKTNVPVPVLVIGSVLLTIPEMVNVPAPLPLLFISKVLAPEIAAVPESVRP